ncbi:MAG: 4'-phosphopantetheinyl transferase superfamily protein [Halioglobus sp.]
MTVSLARAFSVSRELLCLGPQDVHIWLRPSAAVIDSDQFKRSVLSRYAPVESADWKFTVGTQGKPALAVSPLPLDFNLSDSGDWLACAVTGGTPIGVDLEYCEADRDVMKLARRFFQPEEVTCLARCDQAQQVGLFYDYWTLKEARIKASGSALGLELENCGFKLHNSSGEGNEQRVQRIVESPLTSGPPYYYCLFQPVPGYRLAISWLRPGNTRPRVHFYPMMPSSAEYGEGVPSPSLLAASEATEVFNTNA